MSKHQAKQGAPLPVSRTKLWHELVSKLSVRLAADAESQTKRKTLSKLSMIGFNGAGVLFHKRWDRLKRFLSSGQIPRYQNTFRLESYKAFHAETVDKIVRHVMKMKLSTITSYQPDQTSKLCLEIASDVLRAIGKKDYDRYKIVTQVYIIQRFQQSIHATFQCLWDVQRDNYSYHVLENNYIHAWCCVFGVYYD